MILFVTALATASMLSCNSPDLVPEIPFDATNYSILADTSKIKIDNDYKKLQDNHVFSKVLIITQDTVVSFKAPRMPQAPKNKVDLSLLEKEGKAKNEKFKMIAMGGGLTAGFRDFGYFNEGMYTSYPNLVAQQMTIEDFELPLFPEGEFNGVGKMEKTKYNPSGGPFQKFAAVKNNGAGKGISPYTSYSKVLVDKYKGEADNLAFPYMTRGDFGDYNRLYVTNDFKHRLTEGEFDNIYAKIKNKDFDFFIFESGYDDLIGKLTSSQPGAITFRNDLIGLDPQEYNKAYLWDNRTNEITLIRDVLVSKKKVKGVILNMPDVTKLPLVLSGDLVFKNSLFTYTGSPINRYGPVPNILPTSQIDSMLSPTINMAIKPGVNPNYPLRPQSLLTQERLETLKTGTKGFKEQAELLSKFYNLPIVDIATLFEKVLSEKGLTSDDGQKITAKEFFSLDGMYPSAIGQGLIANEVIKTINAAYKTKIPLIAIREMMD